MAGRRPKPTHLKVVTGNPGKRKLNDKEPQPAREIPSPPEHLTDWGKTAWGRMTVLLDGMGILTVADTFALERLCDIYADIEKAQHNRYRNRAAVGRCQHDDDPKAFQRCHRANRA